MSILFISPSSKMSAISSFLNLLSSYRTHLCASSRPPNVVFCLQLRTLHSASSRLLISSWTILNTISPFLMPSIPRLRVPPDRRSITTPQPVTWGHMSSPRNPPKSRLPYAQIHIQKKRRRTRKKKTMMTKVSWKSS